MIDYSLTAINTVDHPNLHNERYAIINIRADDTLKNIEYSSNKEEAKKRARRLSQQYWIYGYARVYDIKKNRYIPL